MAHTIVQREGGLQQVKKVLQDGEDEVKRASMCLLKNMSRYKELHSDISEGFSNIPFTQTHTYKQSHACTSNRTHACSHNHTHACTRRIIPTYAHTHDHHYHQTVSENTERNLIPC